ncbi:MAG: flagellin [Bryobacteraceae bacterium]|nr:flagellin [Bryobacteraceae bacterium]
MSFRINTNVPSLQAQEYLRVNSDFQGKTINRVTSGLRIAASGDDAAGLAIANGFRSDQAVLTQGIRNANDGLSTLQIIDGGINNISKLLDRARTLATQSASGTFTGSRNVLNSEFQSLVTEINRQAQAIGLNTGGQFAKSLSVFIGGGRSSGGITETSNGSVSIDLARSTVDAQSLGLSGVRAASASGADLSTSSATSVQNILDNTTNKNSLATQGFSDFYFRGSGFSDADRIKVTTNLSGVTNTSTLVEALNDAIENAGNGTTAAATAFKNANIRATVVTDTQADGSVKERIGFVSSNAAFQVQAGDRTANAILGNFSTGATGRAIDNNFVARAATAATTTAFAADGSGNIVFRVQGGGLASPVDLTVTTTATTTIDEALVSLSNLVANNTQLQNAGITLEGATAGSTLVFKSSRGESLDVQTGGDTRNLFGLGTFRLATTTSTSLDYTSVTSSGFTGNAALAQVFEFSINGNPTVQAVTVGAGGASSQAGAIATLNAAFAADAALSAAGLRAVAAGGEITIESTNGTAFRLNAQNEAVAGTFGFGGAVAGNGAAFAVNGRNAIVGTATSGIATTDTSSDMLYFKINGGTTQSVDVGTTANLGALVAALNADGTFTGANLRAQAVNNKLAIYSTAGAQVEIVTGANNFLSAVGIEDGTRALSRSTTVNSGGAYNTALGDSNDVISYNQFRYGTDEQTISLLANDSNGGQQTLGVTLRNDAVGRNARNIDEVVATINDQIQNSGNPTLKQVVAVKEVGVNGNADGIRFLSTLQNFRVSLGNVGSSTGTTEVGLYDATVSGLGQGSVVNSEKSSGGSQVDISTVDGATAAVTALANAVSSLGDAQAVVGRGQNSFSFAVNLAQSQLTNLAAAESRIRDADLAAEAANLTKAQIILQAGIAALAQANSAPQQVLSLLRG